MAKIYPPLDECNEVIDWVESQSAVFPDTAAKLKIRIKEWEDYPGQLFIFLEWYSNAPPKNSDVIPPPGWYMYEWYRDERNGQTIWCNTLNKAK